MSIPFIGCSNVNPNPVKQSRREFVGSVLATASLTSLAIGDEHGDRADVAWLAEIQRPPRRLPDNAPRLAQLLVDARGKPVRDRAGWRIRAREIRGWWLEFLGQLPRPEKTPPLTLLGEDKAEGVIRTLVRYETEKDVHTEAYVLKPSDRRGRLPGIVVLHSTVDHTIRQPAGVEGRPEKAFGLKLARQGYVTICPRNFLWEGEKKIDARGASDRFHRRHPNCKGMAKMLHDDRVALDILQKMPDVDPQRLGAVGHSLGAKEVLYLAALDGRVKVAVSSEGGVGTRFSNWDAIWYLGPEIRGRDFSHEHHELLAVVAPRAFLLIGGDSADGDRSWPFIEAVLPVWKLYGGRPRIGLFNHKKGHSVPPEAERRIAQWFKQYL